MVTWMQRSTMLWVRPSDFFLALLILLNKMEVNTLGFTLTRACLQSHYQSFTLLSFLFFTDYPHYRLL